MTALQANELALCTVYYVKPSVITFVSQIAWSAPRWIRGGSTARRPCSALSSNIQSVYTRTISRSRSVLISSCSKDRQVFPCFLALASFVFPQNLRADNFGNLSSKQTKSNIQPFVFAFDSPRAITFAEPRCAGPFYSPLA